MHCGSNIHFKTLLPENQATKPKRRRPPDIDEDDIDVSHEGVETQDIEARMWKDVGDRASQRGAAKICER